MPRWQIALAVFAILGGIVTQIPNGMPGATMTSEASFEWEDVARLEPPQSEHGSETIVLEVSGMTCVGCEAAAEMAVGRVTGVRHADFLYEAAQGYVTYDPGSTNDEEILAKLTQLTGLRAQVIERR